MATAKEMRELTIDDLKRRAQELREGLFQDQLKLKTGGLDNPSQRTAKRRDLARVLGTISEKERAAKAKPEETKA